MQNLNKTPLSGTFGDVAKVLDTNFGLVVAKLIELEQSHRGSNVGFYASESALKTAYPSPTKGLMAFVGTGKTYTIYRCTTAGTWTKTSETFTFDTSVDLSNYTTTDTFNALKVIVDNMATGATYMGAATTSTNPGTPSVKVVYLASEVGTYTHFGSLSVVVNEFALLYYNGSAWVKNSIDLSSNIAEIKTMAEMALEKASQGVLFVSLANLDMVLGSTPHDVLEALQKSNGKTLKYLVYYNDYIVGYIDMFGDSVLHCLTQEFSTNYLINNDGTITEASAHNHKLHKYVRYYNIRWTDATDWRGDKWAIGTWTKWNSPTEDIESDIATLQNADKSLQTNIDAEVAARKTADENLQEQITVVKNSVGKADGIAPLNANTMVDDAYLPKEVLEISGFVDGVDYVLQSAASIDSVVYDTERNTFFGKQNTGTDLKPVYKYYNNWQGRVQYCAEAEGAPYTEKIYVTTDGSYYYDGESLVCIGKDNTQEVTMEKSEREAADAKIVNSLNTEAASRQNADKLLSTSISNEATERKAQDEALQTSITAINGKFLYMTEAEYEALSTYDETTYYMLTEE